MVVLIEAEITSNGGFFVQFFPITLFASIMGITGLSIAYMRAAQHYPILHGVGNGLSLFAFGLFLVISGCYLGKIVRFPEEARHEFNHPVRFNFFPAISISLLLLAIAMMESFPSMAKGLWVTGTIAHLAFTLTAVSRWIGRLYSIQQFNPSWFIPVVGNILVPIAGVEFASKEISWFFFSIGLVFWLSLFAIMVYRLGFHGDLPGKLVPTLFILIAPPAIGFVSYFRLTGSFDAAGRILIYLALFIALLLFTMYKKFLELPFFMSWWAYTFPICALAIAQFIAFRATQFVFFQYCGTALLVISTLVILLVALKTLGLIRAGKLCVPEE